MPSDFANNHNVSGNGSLTRALEGGMLSPTVFRKYLKNGGAQQSCSTCAQIKNTHCVQFFTFHVKKSGHQVRYVMSLFKITSEVDFVWSYVLFLFFNFRKLKIVK